MFKLQHSNTPILQHSKAHGYVPDVQLILAAMDLSSYPMPMVILMGFLSLAKMLR